MAKRKSPPLGASERGEMERGLDRGGAIREIARAIGRQPSTVSREVRANRTPANLAVTAPPGTLPPPDCERLQGSPGVCNACPKLRQAGCGHRRWVYRAGRAAAESARRRSESRQGIDMEPEAAGRALAAVGDGIGRGMSPYEVSRGMPPDVRVSPSTIYDWVERGYVSCNLALQRKVRFKPRKRRAAPPSPRKPAARSYRAFRALPEDERSSAWEMDTLQGLASDRRRVLTLYSRASRLQLALLLPSGSCGAVKGALEALRGCAPGAFSRVFPGPVLTDNGSEFSDWDGIGAIFGEEPGGAPRLYYCDPMSPGQKGGCEKNHTELRQVLGKGAFSFDLLAPADLSLAMSHANSNPRKSLCGMSPVRAFLSAYGDDGAALLDALGVCEVRPGELLLRPELLNAGRLERGDAPIAM